MIKDITYTIVMSTDTNLVIRSIVGVLAGLLIASGYLPSETKDAFINDASTVGGLTLTIISLIYMLEHALIKVKGDLANPPTAITTTVDNTKPGVTTTTTIPVTPTTETPSLATNG